MLSLSGSGYIWWRMLKRMIKSGILVVVLTIAAATVGNAAPVVITVDGRAQFDPPSLPGGGAATAPFGIVSGQRITLEVGYDDALIGNGTHRASSATGITIAFTLGAPGQEVMFTETDEFCFDNASPSCDGFPSISLLNGVLLDINYFGGITIGADSFLLAAANDFAEADPVVPGFRFDWLLYNGDFTQTLAGGVLAIAEPGTMLLLGVGLTALGVSRRRRGAQA